MLVGHMEPSLESSHSNIGWREDGVGLFWSRAALDRVLVKLLAFVRMYE